MMGFMRYARRTNAVGASIRRSLAFVLLALAPASADGQAVGECALVPTARPGIGAALEDYRRAGNLVAADADPAFARRGSNRSSGSTACATLWDVPADMADGIGAAPVQIDMLYNSAYPSGLSSGQLWPGRGWSILASGGALARLGPLSLSIEPAFAYHANRSFGFVQRDTARPEFSHPWLDGIDWPLRPGDDAYSTMSPGQSYVRLDFPAVAFGVSTENLWWGPAMRNALILGNEAAGFPHVFVNSGQGWNTALGRITAELIWGMLSESVEFRSPDGDHRRLLSGANVGWTPIGVEGLALGVARIHHARYEEGAFPTGSLVPLVEQSVGVEAGHAENLTTIFARYAVPRTGFELYGEWGWQSARRDTIPATGPARGYTAGFQVVSDHGERWYRFRGELTNLNAVRYTGDDTPNWYTHPQIPEGYTHRGQLLGARIGPGSDAQYVGFDVFTRWGRHGVFLERIRYDEVSHYRWIVPLRQHRGHDVELTGGTEHIVWFGQLGIRAGVSVSSRRNRHFRYCNPIVLATFNCQARAFRDLNWQVPLSVMWRPR